MRRLVRTLLPAAALLLPAAAAEAQTMTVCIELIEGRDADELPSECGMITNVPIGIDECEANTRIRMQVNNVPAGASLLDFWRSQGSDCSQSLERDGEDDTCLPLFAEETADQAEVDVTVGVQDLVDCTLGQPMQTSTIYVLAADTSPERGEVSAFGTLTIAVDTARPDAPTDMEGGRGDTSIPVKWDLSAGNLFEHRIYAVVGGTLVGGGGAIADAGAPADAGGGGEDAGPPSDAGTDAGMTSDAGTDAGGTGGTDAGGTGGTDAGGTVACDTGGLSAGDLLVDADPVEVVGGTVSEVDIDPRDLGLGFGESAAIFVVAVDQARNESPLSEPACIERVETIGFCERIGGCEDEGCTCGAAPGAARSPVALGWVAALAAGALVVVRRRRRR